MTHEEDGHEEWFVCAKIQVNLHCFHEDGRGGYFGIIEWGALHACQWDAHLKCVHSASLPNRSDFDLMRVKPGDELPDGRKGQTVRMGPIRTERTILCTDDEWSRIEAMIKTGLDEK